MLQSREVHSLAADVEIVPSNYFAALDLEAIYGRSAPLEVDLGCGDGTFLAQIAEANRERDFLGIERLLGRVQSAKRKIIKGKLTNARVLRIETSYAIAHLLPTASVAVFYLMFPDPWPKRRHWRRRVVTENFLASIHRSLMDGGLLQITTDQINYFQEIERLGRQSKQFVVNLNTERPQASSTFEKRFGESEIYRLVLRKVSEVT